MLKNSALNSTFDPSVILKRLFITTSACQKFGPCSELRLRLPNVPGAGIANAAGLRNWRSLPRNGLTPAIKSGRRTFRDDPPPGVLITNEHPAPPTTPVEVTHTVSGRVTRISMGNPLLALMIVPTSQLPRIAL